MLLLLMYKFYLNLINFKVDPSLEFLEFPGNGALLFLCFDTLIIRIITIFLRM